MAALTHEPKFGSFSLAIANNVLIEDVREQLLHRSTFRSRLSGNGALHNRSQNTGTRIGLKGKVWGADEGARRDKESALRNALQNGRQLLQVWDDRWIECMLEGPIKFGIVRGSTFGSRAWEATLRSEWDSWYGTAVVDGPYNVTSFPDTRALPNHAGDAPTYPVIEILNNDATIQDKSILLTNTTGSQLSLQGFELQTDQVLTIDMWDGRIGDGTVSSPRVASVEGDFWTIPGGSTISLELASNAGAVDLDVTVTFKPRYWSGV